MAKFVFDIETNGLLNVLNTVHCIVLKNIEDEKINRLKELDNLRKSGILTNQEFEKLKSDLIN